MLMFIFCFGCQSKRIIPDVSGIKADVSVKRFERDFFAIDTNNISASLSKLQQQYGSFLNDYLYNILSVPAMPDSIVKNVKLFLHDYKPVYDSAELQFPSFDKQEKEIRKGLQLTKYYFSNLSIAKTNHHIYRSV